MSTESESPSLGLPLALIALTMAILLASQIGASKQSTRVMQWQSETLKNQITALQTADKQAAEAIKNREPVVKQSGELQNQLQTLLNELLDLSKDDKDAQEIIKKWQVQRNATPGAADAKPADAKPADAKK